MCLPELENSVVRARSVTAAQFWKSWVGTLDMLQGGDSDTLFNVRKGFVIGAVRLTPALWSELSLTTQTAIWKYLRTLTLESAMEVGVEDLGTDIMKKLVAIMSTNIGSGSGSDSGPGSGPGSGSDPCPLDSMMDQLKGLIGSSFSDLSGFEMPEIPEHLRTGRIAKLAEDMAKQFNPAEFGIDPALLTGDNVEEILKRLADLYQRDPTLLIGGAKRVAERIKTQIMGGSLNREELVAEAEEFIALFKDHPMFKEIMGKVTGGLGGLGGLAEMFGSAPSEGAPSERRRAVQERLRRKLAERQGKR